MVTILTERGISVMGSNGLPLNAECEQCKTVKGLHDGRETGRCCLRRICAKLPDFLAEKPAIAKYLEERGHVCLFLPKFHCELNYIERIWGIMKNYLRSQQDDGDSRPQQVIMQEAYERIPLKTHRLCAQSCVRMEGSYRGGLTGRVAAFAARIFSGHREVPAYVYDLIDKHADESNSKKENYIKQAFDSLKQQKHGVLKPNRPDLQKVTASRKVFSLV